MDTAQQVRVKIVQYVHASMKQNPQGSCSSAESAAAIRAGEPMVGAELQYLIESGKLKKHSQAAGQTYPRVTITARGQAGTATVERDHAATSCGGALGGRPRRLGWGGATQGVGGT